MYVAAVSNLASAAGDWQSVSSRGQIGDSCHNVKQFNISKNTI